MGTSLPAELADITMEYSGVPVERNTIITPHLPFELENIVLLYAKQHVGETINIKQL
jgi:hypothetical protein